DLAIVLKLQVYGSLNQKFPYQDKEFSKLRPVFKQSALTSKIILMLSPPYGGLFKNVVNLMLKMRL
ncbi:MAG: hypothetical protein V7765_20190, partial [Oleispira sp.]